MSVVSSATSPDNVEEPPPKRPNRSCVACTRCHAHKVKCSGERPKCRNCQQAKNPSECVYPKRDRKVVVPESHLKNLEAEIKELKRKRSSERIPYISPASTTDIQEACRSDRYPSNASGDDVGPSLGEDLSFAPDEASIQPHYIGEAACTTFGNRLHQYLTGKDGPLPPRRPHYYKSQKLHRFTGTDCQLPNRNDARLLVRVVLRFIGPDYHLILRKSFLEKLDETYRLGSCDDPIWFCRLFVVFALGELYSTRTSKTKTGRGVPGTAYFVKAMSMFEDLYEEPTIPYIETLLLIAFYSCALNRKNTAYTYAGLALRLSLTLGLHRKIPENVVISRREREHSIRVWWTVYILDRVCSSKVGLPIMLRDEDVDVPLPSMDGLTPLERDDFHDPNHINAQLKLARITGDILNEIYHIPQPGRANHYVQSVQRILGSLREWREKLPDDLKFNQQKVPMYSSRSVASLHLNFSQCVILTTRPIFFHLLRSQYESSTGRDAGSPKPLSPAAVARTEALAEACVQEARISSAILAQLWVDCNLATYGFFDALSIFSSTLVLTMASTMKFKTHENDADSIETSLNLLKSMRDDGNMPAHDYYEQLVQLKGDLDQAREEMSGNYSEARNMAMLQLAASGSYDGEPLERATMAEELAYDGMNIGSLESFDTGAALEGPFIQEFLRQQPFAGYTGDSIAEFSNGAGDPNGPFYGWENSNHYGML